MGTTALFAELLVIGLGAVLWATLFLAIALGINAFDFKMFSSPLALVGLLSMAYMLGIVVDRFADGLLKPSAKRIRSRQYQEHLDFQNDREYVYQHTALRQSFEYGRSRLRVARGWFINSILITAGLLLHLSTSRVRFVELVVVVVGGGLLTFGNLQTWKSFVRSEAENIKTRAKFLRSLGAP